MDITITKLPGSKVTITGELPADIFGRAWKEAIEFFSSAMRVDGFRAGKIPEQMVIEKHGEAAILQKTAEFALRDAYPRILAEQHIDAIGQPEITITKLARGNPIGFSITTAVLPDVTLPDYGAIARRIFGKKEEIDVSEKDMSDALERIRNTHVKHETAEHRVEQETPPQLPELDDAFARQIGKFDSLEDLKRAIEKNIRLEKEARAKEKKRAEALDAIAEQSVITIPDALAEAERDQLIANIKKSVEESGITWERYLAQIKKTEDQLREEWRAEGERRARYGLVVHALIQKERITPDNAEVERLVSDIIAHNPKARELDKNRLHNYAYGMVTNESVFRFLERIAEQTPNLP